jgi:putative transposase
LPEYDYSRPGAYFVTLVTYQREPLFGEVTNGNVCLTAAGEAVREIWETLPGRYPQIELPPGERRSHRRKMLIPLVIGYFKMNSAKRINQILGSQGVPVWQRNYYEHIVRDERELSRIRQYICNNPLQWETDQENPFHYQE